MRKSNVTKTIKLVMVMAVVTTIGCGGMALAADKTLLMATTTSTDNTGLLDYLAPYYKKATGIELKWIAVGTGKAMKMGENCDVDVLMVHSPAAEKQFVEAGFGISRREVMYNDFIVIGPASDPAGIKGKGTIEALSAVATKEALFVSRGDDSGTHKKELSLWKTAISKTPDKETWYVQTGQGMLASIAVAAERKGYILTDRGTYIKYEANMKGNPPLKIVVEGDDALKNQYSVILLETKRCPKVKQQLARQFADWITGEQGQKLIREFKVMGKALFVPNAQ